jgi:putative Ca2+/H+ antiporter (TMEM165/GDT1 family)
VEFSSVISSLPPLEHSSIDICQPEGESYSKAPSPEPNPEPNQASNSQKPDPQELKQTDEQPGNAGLAREIQIFFSTFITIFLAELGDKTQVTTLLMSAESHAPWVVFAGAGMALVATSLIGVMVGHWLSKRVSQRTLEVSAAVMLLVVALLLVWDVVWA